MVVAVVGGFEGGGLVQFLQGARLLAERDAEGGLVAVDDLVAFAAAVALGQAPLEPPGGCAPVATCRLPDQQDVACLPLGECLAHLDPRRRRRAALPVGRGRGAA